jgi:hypothetical protein
MCDSGVIHTLKGLKHVSMQQLFPGMPHQSHPRESLYKQPVMPNWTHDAPGIQYGPALDTTTRQSMTLHVGDGRWSTAIACPQTQGPTYRALGPPARHGGYLLTMS